MVPGDLHGELEWLVGCGLSPRETLVAATRAPARWLSADSLGVIAEGRIADLAVLTADPLTDIRNTRLIRNVVRRGVILDPEEVLATIDRGPP